MKIGDLIRIKDPLYANLIGKIGIVVVCGTWSVDVRMESGSCPRIAKEDCEVISESR